MAAREACSRWAPVLLSAVMMIAGCRAATAPPDGAAPLPPQTVVAPPASTLAGAPAEVPPERPAPPTPSTPEPETPATPLDPARERAKTLIVIDTAEDEEVAESQDLAAAARRERDRRRATETPIAVIDQKNLATWAKGGVLTQTAEAEAPSPAEAAASEIVEKAAVEEAYWRRRGREIRQRWRDAQDQIAVLEAKSESLRTKFYSTDDGYVRDTQIKPEWDKAIADLEEARYIASRGAAEVLAFLEEGRKAGALPGWLRDGVELEPEPVLETASEPEATIEAGDPVIYRDPEVESESTEPPPGARHISPRR